MASLKYGRFSINTEGFDGSKEDLLKILKGANTGGVGIDQIWDDIQKHKPSKKKKNKE
jgi:hypothetical protein